MKEIGVASIGFGFMGKTHTFGYKAIPLYYDNLPYTIKLVGICDAVESVAKAAAEANGYEFWTTDPDEIIARDDVHIINISTPNIYHKETILKALKAGKHVYCDKPLVVSYDEAQEVLEAAEASNLTTQMALQYRFFPSTMRAKQIIEEGRLGRIVSFRGSYLHSGSIDPTKPIGWKQDKRVGGGGVLFDLGSHILDLLYHLMGEYDSVFCKTQILYPQRPDKGGNMIDITADDCAMMICQMKNGAMGTVEASKVATGTDDELRFEIHGTEGALRFNLMDPNYIEFYDNTISDSPLGGDKGFTRIASVQRFDKPGGSFTSNKNGIGWIRSHVHCLYNFINNAYEGKKSSPSFREGAYIQHVMEKAYLSDEKSAWVKIDD